MALDLNPQHGEAGLAAMAEPPDVIVAANDDMALGAMEAVKARNLSDKIAILGFDALPEALAAYWLPGRDTLPRDVDAVVLSACVQMPSLGVIDAAERTLTRPRHVAGFDLVAADDLAGFQVPVEKSLTVRYGDYEIHANDTWCQGISLLQALATLRDTGVGRLDHNSAAYLHLVRTGFRATPGDRRPPASRCRRTETPAA